EYIFFPLEVNRVICGQFHLNVNFPVLIYITQALFDRINVSGLEQITFKARIKKVYDEVDSWQFQYKRFLYSEGYFFSAFIFNKHQILKVEQKKAFSFKWVYFYISNFLNSLSSEYGYEVNFIQALLFGATYKLTAHQTKIYINSGTYHFFAVSGFSVAVLYIFVYYLLNLFLFNFKTVNFISIFVVWFYIFLCGYVPGGVRAAIIITLYLLAHLLSRKDNPLHTLLLSFIFILVLGNPFALFDVSLQYSFIIYSAIIFIFKNVKFNLFDDEKNLYRILNSALNFLFSLALVTFIAYISILPLSIKYFGAGKLFFLENILANCISSLIFSFYFIVSLFFLILLLVAGWLPPILWSIFKGVYYLEKILAVFSGKLIYYGIPYQSSLYVFYIIFFMTIFLFYSKKMRLWHCIITLFIFQTLFSTLSNYPRRYKENQIYSITHGKKSVYYFIKQRDEVVVIYPYRFNKRLVYSTISFLRYIRFLEGRVIFVLAGHHGGGKILFRNYIFMVENIDEFVAPEIVIKKIKVTKKLINLFLSFNDFKILYLESVNKQWLKRFFNNEKVNVIEISQEARKSPIFEALCVSSQFIVNRSKKFTLACEHKKVFNTYRTILLSG
ncbi:MAG: ComEC/Rec2 family competence protein, partial [Planctomycetota bacterium]